MTIHSHLSGLFRCVLGAFLALTSVAVAAAQAEFHHQYGKLTNPFSSVREYTSILTVQHATSWRLGDSYLFVDILDDGGHDGFNDKNFYGEWYPTLSFSKLSGTEFQLGPIRRSPFFFCGSGFSGFPFLFVHRSSRPYYLSYYLYGLPEWSWNPDGESTTNGRGKLARSTAICG